MRLSFALLPTLAAAAFRTALACASLFCVSPVLGADWPEFLGPNRDNTSPERGLLSTFPPDGPPRVWEREIGTGYSAPSVLGDTLVLHHRMGDEEIVEAMSASTGKTLWKNRTPSHFVDPFGYNNGPRCSPLLHGGKCYTFGAEGLFTCLDLADGRLLWQRHTAKEWQIPEAFFGVGSSPLMADGRIFLILGAQPNAAVVALDAATGKTLWENVGEKTWNGLPKIGWPGTPTVQWNPGHPDFEKQASYCTPVLAIIHGRQHLLCVTRQGLVSLDPPTGEAHFSFWFRARQDSSVNAMTPVVEGDAILLSTAYFGNGSVLLRVKPDGRGVDEVWRGRALEMHWARPILTGGHLYAWSGRNEPDARFRCVEWLTGNVLWERYDGWPNGGHSKLSPGERPPDVFGRASAILADDKIYALGECGLLGIFKPNTAKLEELSRFQVPGLTYPCWAGPVLAEKRLYLRSEDRLVCLNLAEE